MDYPCPRWPSVYTCGGRGEAVGEKGDEVVDVDEKEDDETVNEKDEEGDKALGEKEEQDRGKR